MELFGLILPTEVEQIQSGAAPRRVDMSAISWLQHLPVHSYSPPVPELPSPDFPPPPDSHTGLTWLAQAHPSLEGTCHSVEACTHLCINLSNSHGQLYEAQRGSTHQSTASAHFRMACQKQKIHSGFTQETGSDILMPGFPKMP